MFLSEWSQKKLNIMIKYVIGYIMTYSFLFIANTNLRIHVNYNSIINMCKLTIIFIQNGEWNN
jgi:hypothetical protein